MVASRAVLITGAAGGIGGALASRLRRRGDMVIAADLALPANASSSDAVTRAIAMDVAETHSVSDAFTEIDRVLNGRPLDAVVHCAAICPLGTIEFMPAEEHMRTINVNALGTLRVAQQALPRLRGHGGRLVMISSLWGKVSGPLVGSYAASKHAIEAIADALRREIVGSDIRISLIEPGVVATSMLTNQTAEMTAKMARLPSEERRLYLGVYEAYLKLFEKSIKSAISPDTAAAAIEAVLDARSPATRYRVGNDSKLLTTLGKWLPDRWMDGIFRKMLGL